MAKDPKAREQALEAALSAMLEQFTPPSWIAHFKDNPDLSPTWHEAIAVAEKARKVLEDR